MPVLEGVSERAVKVLQAMKSAGYTSEAKMGDAEHITKVARLPKGQVAEALQELSAKKLVKRHAGEKAAKYHTVEGP
jgi:RIO-like serine/threonine protein kinase